jgi:hypothetical protein
MFWSNLYIHFESILLCPLNRSKVCQRAALEGSLEGLQCAQNKGCPWDESTCANAAKCGRLNVLQWARKNGCKWNDLTCRFGFPYCLNLVVAVKLTTLVFCFDMSYWIPIIPINCTPRTPEGGDSIIFESFSF